MYQKHAANQMGAEGNKGNLIEGHLIVVKEANDVAGTCSCAAVSLSLCVFVAFYYCISPHSTEMVSNGFSLT